MSNPKPSVRAGNAASGADVAVRLAAQYADQLRQAFHQQADARPDALVWHRLEYDAADLLERRFNDTPASTPMVPSLSELDQALLQTVAAALFRNDPTQRRVVAYREAIASVCENAANWIFLQGHEIAYWKHAALVWMTLWHVSASRAITPADMATCLGLTSPAPSIPFPAPEPAAPPPAPSPAAERVRTFSASRFGLGDRSVLAGNARLMAARLRTKRADTAVGLGLSAFIGTVVFCFVMMALSIMANPILVIFWAGAMSAAAGVVVVAAVVAVLWGWIIGGMSMKGASRRVAAKMGLDVVAPEHPLQQRMVAMSAAIGFKRAPRVGIFPAKDINGFAVADKDGAAVIGVSQAAVDQLSQGQIDALLSHELGHIVTGDMERMMFARCFQGALVLWMLFSPLKALGRWAFSTLGEMMILNLSRSREYRADAFGAAMAGKANMIALLNALETRQPRAPSATKVAPELFFHDVARRLFSTHPPITMRIRAVKKENHIRSLRLTYSE